jgi:hypothetical protein
MHITVQCLRMSRYPERHIMLSSLRLIRKSLTLNDPFYVRHALKTHMLSAVFAMLLKVEARDNLVTSAILDTFHQMRHSSKLKEAWEHLKKHYMPGLQAVSYAVAAAD